MKRYMVLPVLDQDPGIILDILAATAENLRAELKARPDSGICREHIADLERICAEIGYYQNDVSTADGRLADVLHVTAYCTLEDPRPKE